MPVKKKGQGYTAIKRRGQHQKKNGQKECSGTHLPQTSVSTSISTREGKHDGGNTQPITTKTQSSLSTQKQTSYRLRSVTEGEKADSPVRDVKPPPPDNDFIKLVNSPPSCVHTVIHTQDINDDLTRQKISKETLRLLGISAPKQLKRAVRDGLAVSAHIPRWVMHDNFFQTKAWKRPKASTPFRGNYPIYFEDLLNTTLPTRYIGFGHKPNDRRCIIAKGKPRFHPKLDGKVPDLKYDYDPYYKFTQHSNHYIRVADYMNIACIIRAYQLCGENYFNFLCILLITCHNVYNKQKQKYTVEDEYDVQALVNDRIIPVCTALDLIMEEQLKIHPTEKVRQDWLTWNPFVVEYDKYYNPQMQIFRQTIRDNFIQDRGIQESDKLLHFQWMALFCFVLIMIPSGSCKDELCEKAFYGVINGRHDCRSFLSLLQKHSIQTMLDHFCSIYKPCGGMQQLKAHSLLTFLIPLQVLNNGEVNINMLNSYPQINNKKSRIALNGYGMYRGVGADTWTLRFLGMFIDAKSETEKKKIAYAIATLIPLMPGLNLNDNLGELAQQYQKGGEGMAWASNVYKLLAEQCKSFEEVYPNFIALLDGLKK